MSSKYPNEDLFSVLHFPPNWCSLAEPKVNLFAEVKGRSVLLCCLSWHFATTKNANKLFVCFFTSLYEYRHTIIKFDSFHRFWSLLSIFLCPSKRARNPVKHCMLQEAADIKGNKPTGRTMFGAPGLLEGECEWPELEWQQNRVYLLTAPFILLASSPQPKFGSQRCACA